MTAPPIAPHKNRRAWLIFYGVVEILIACVCLLMVLGTLLVTQPTVAGSPVSPTALKVLNTVLYGGIAVVFLVIGVGSIRCRNWARLAMIGVSSLWLTTGLISAVFSFVLFPVIRQQSKLPPELEGTVIAVMAAVMGIGFLLMPPVFLIFYSLKSVKATCQAGTVPSTGSSSPGSVPVIALAILEGLGGLVIVSFVWVRVTVVFGVVLHGLPAFLLLLAHTIASGFTVWLILRRRFAGWMLALVKTIFWTVSTVMTFAGRDLIQLSREMDLDPKQLQTLQQFPQVQSLTWIMTVVSMGATLIFIWSTRKFFPPGNAA